VLAKLEKPPMAKPPRLNDLQLVLLAHAHKRDDGSIIPLPESLATEGEQERVRQAIEALCKRDFLQEQQVTDRRQAWHSDGDEPIGLFLTDAGRSAIAPDETASSVQASPNPINSESEPKPTSKIAIVIGLLSRAEGATMDELTGATGWLPHSARAVLTGLRKKGYTIARGKRGEATCYAISAAV